MKAGLVIAAPLALITALPVVIAAVFVSVIAPAAEACETDDQSAASSGAWRVPVAERFRVSSAFGMRFHPVRHRTSLHTGIDLVVTGRDRSIVAAARGRVVERGFNVAYGNQVVLEHGGGVRTRYAHMAGASTTTEGETVAAGKRLGTQGATGYVTGPHLHFEVMVEGRPIDPAPFMEERGAPLDGDARKRADSAHVGSAPSRVGATRLDGRTVTFDAAQLANARTIVAEGRASGVGRRGIIVALATALQESGLRNLDHGDRDSLGLFQQRPSTGWGSASQVRDPRLAARAFYGTATHTNNAGLLQVRRWRSMTVTAAAQAVQRSAFPHAYSKWEPVAEDLASGLAETPPVDCQMAPSGDLRVVTWNLCAEWCRNSLGPWSQRRDEVAAAIKRATPDVLALQEAGRKTAEVADLQRLLAPEFRIAVHKRSKVIFYRTATIDVNGTRGRRLPSSSFAHRDRWGVVQVFRQRTNDRAFVVANLHPKNGVTRASDRERRVYVDRAEAEVDKLLPDEDTPVVIAGDLNSYIPGAHHKRSVAARFAARGLVSSETVAVRRVGDQWRSYNGGRRPERGRRIDHVVVDPADFRVTSWRQILASDPDRPVTDHHLIIVDLAWKGNSHAA